MQAYTYLHVVFVAGIILSAVGDELVIAHPTEVLPPHEVAAVAAGPAVYLLAHTIFGYRLAGRKILARYAEKAGLERPISPHKMRHFLFTWLKKQGVDDALIQPYSGHSSRKSLEIYSLLAIGEAQESYDEVMGRFPV